MECYMEALCQGDISALNHIYEEFNKPLYAFMVTLTRNHAVAEDLLQETFIKVYSKANQYIKGTNLKAWIFSMGRNLAYDYLRSNKSNWDELETISNSIVIEDEVLNKLNISKALFILPDIDREIVIMHVVGGFKHSEIAKELCLNSNTVRWKYREAIKKLNEYLGEETIGESYEKDNKQCINDKHKKQCIDDNHKKQCINNKSRNYIENDAIH